MFVAGLDVSLSASRHYHVYKLQFCTLNMTV